MYFNVKNRTDEDQMQADILLSSLVAPLFQSVWPMTQMDILSSFVRGELEDFLEVYGIACYLAPIQKLMPSHQVKWVKQYLRGEDMFGCFIR